MRVSVDHDRCTGHGRCYELAPDVFVDDEAGYSHVRIEGCVPPVLEAGARRAASACPEAAISLS